MRTLARHLANPAVCLAYALSLSAFAVAGGSGSENVLHTKVSLFSSQSASLEQICDDLRKQGILVGLEVDVDPFSVPFGDYTPEARKKVSLALESNNTLGAVLHGVVQSYPSYTWHIAENSAFVHILPRTNALCMNRLSPYSVTNASLRDIFHGPRTGLSDLKISLVGRGRSRPVYHAIFIDLPFPGGTLRDFLDLVCAQVGGQTSWTLAQGTGDSTVQFHFMQPAHLLGTYRPNDYWWLAPEAQLAKAREQLSKAPDDHERIEALKKIASLTDNPAEVSRCYDQAIGLATSDEEKWWLEASRLATLYPPGRKSEEAIVLYQELLQNCPFDNVVLFAVSDAAHHYRVLGRPEDGAAMLKSAYHKYPSAAKSIRETMTRQFPEHLRELPEVDEPSESQAHPEAFFNSPPSNR
ncbi:MAG: hypothetical protein V1929_06660 [bacterium]